MRAWRRVLFAALTFGAAAACFSSSKDDGCGFGHVLDRFPAYLGEASFVCDGCWFDLSGDSGPCGADYFPPWCACNAQPVCVGRFSDFADRDLYYWECPDAAVATCAPDAPGDVALDGGLDAAPDDGADSGDP